MEEEKDDQLPFLDILVCRVKDNQFRMPVYRKPRHTNRYINYISRHDSGVFRGTIHCLRDRVYNVCDDTSHSVELKHLYKFLALNGYRTHLTIGTLRRKPIHRNSSEQSMIHQRTNRRNTCSCLTFEV